MSRYDTIVRAILPHSTTKLRAEEMHKNKGTRHIMDSVKATEHSQDSRRQNTTLDDRYGKIGISAVAAAIRHQGELRNARDAGYDAD
jgi:DNA-binding IclR family transcriptional regulator